jgi:hypothetical protein
MTSKEHWDALQQAVRVDCQNLKSLLLVLWSVIGFAVAFPSHVRDREQMRSLLRQFGANMPPFPGLYDDDAEPRPCADCATTLRVSPYVAGAGIPVVCPLCGIQRARLMRRMATSRES